MCGRFSLGSSSEAVQKIYGAPCDLPLTPRYNIAPGQQILAIKLNNDKRLAAKLHWGLIPAWARDRSIGAKLINARGETLAEKPSFRSAYKSRRCLIPADGFYEWKTAGKTKQPYYFQRVDQQLFSFAGIWETWADKETQEVVASCAIITTAANSLASAVHPRMPVVIAENDFQEWLQGDSRHLQRLLEPVEWPDFKVFPVTTFVNNARNEGARCVEQFQG